MKIIATYVFFTIAIVIISAACVTKMEKPVSNLSNAEKDKALVLMQANCFSCHIPEMGVERAAPPMFKVQQHYNDKKITKNEFVERIVAYVQNPTEDKGRMPGAVRNFGMMPKLNFKAEDIRLIAKYLYEVDMSTDAWDKAWEDFKNRPQNPHTEEISYEDRALRYANGAKAELGKNLIRAINSGGAAYAVEFCNLKAIPLIDSMATLYSAKIKRVSDRPRNPANQANAHELAYIGELKTALQKADKLQPKIVASQNVVTAYFAIETNAMCMQCHGKPQQILPETMQKINRLYPNDKAVGYDVNQIRGIFVVEMDKK